jgi:hypothetical protein
VAYHLKLLKEQGWKILLNGLTNLDNNRVVTFRLGGKAGSGTYGMLDIPHRYKGDQHYWGQASEKRQKMEPFRI